MLFNLAQCEEQRGRLANAWQSSAFRLEPSLEVGAALIRARFEFNGTELWTAPAVHGSAALALHTKLF